MKIVYLARVVETLPDDAIDDDPGQEQEAEEVGLDLPHLLDTWTYVQNLVAADKIELLMPSGIYYWFDCQCCSINYHQNPIFYCLSVDISVSVCIQSLPI